MLVNLHVKDFRDFPRFGRRHRGHAVGFQHLAGTACGHVVSDLIGTGAGQRRSICQKSQIQFIDDGTGMPVGVGRFVGRHSVLAFGNLDGDRKCLN